MWLPIVLSLSLFFVINHLGNSTPLMGPAEVVIKHSENCKLSLPTMLESEMRLYSRRGKLVFQTNFTFPFPVSDDIGYALNVAVKRNGGWKPNFMKLQGTGVCSFVKAGEPNLFKMMAKELKAPEPAKCPLPAGVLHLDYSGIDVSNGMKQYGMEVLPYGEFRITANISHKGDVFFCNRFFADLVPKKSRGG